MDWSYLWKWMTDTLLQSVFNSLKILDLLSVEDELGVTEISKKLNLGKATVFRILYTLEKKNILLKQNNQSIN